MKAIIHIGMPKTGSTTIQTWMRSNRASIEAGGMRSIGVDEPLREALTFAPLHVALHEMGIDRRTLLDDVEIWMRFKADRIEGCYEFLTEEFQKLSCKPGTFICSHEGLYGHGEIHARALDKFLSRFFDDRTYVVYIRDTLDTLLSLYSQKLRNFREVLYTKLDFQDVIDRWTELDHPFGKTSSIEHLFFWDGIVGDKLNVRLLESDWMVNGDLIEDFASLVGFDVRSKPGRTNESFAAEYTEYVRFLNREFGSALPAGIRRKTLEILTAASAGKPKLAVSDEQAERIREKNRDLEDRVRKRFFPDRSRLFSLKSRGPAVMPLPLSDSRKAKIDSEIGEKMKPEVWDPYELAFGGDFAIR